MIFVDTSAWFAAVVPTDADYPPAVRWLAANSEQLLTTDYVIDETLLSVNYVMILNSAAKPQDCQPKKLAGPAKRPIAVASTKNALIPLSAAPRAAR